MMADSADMMADSDYEWKIGPLKRYKGHLTRLYSGIETMLIDSGTHMQALVKKNTLDGFFARYNEKAKDLLYFTRQPDDYDRLLQDHMRGMELRSLFDKGFSRWFRKACKTREPAWVPFLEVLLSAMISHTLIPHT